MSNGELDQDLLSGVQTEVEGLSNEQVREELLKVRTRQKRQQQKHQDPAKQKAYQMKVREKNRLLKERAVADGSWDEINQQAAELANQQLAEEAESATE